MPDANIEIKLEHVVGTNMGKDIKRVSVVGSGVELKWTASKNRLTIITPSAQQMNEIATVLKVEFK